MAWPTSISRHRSALDRFCCRAARNQYTDVAVAPLPLTQACLYLFTHIVLVSVGLYSAQFLFHNFALHTVLLFVLVCSAVRAGANYYRYSFGQKLNQALMVRLHLLFVSLCLLHCSTARHPNQSRVAPKVALKESFNKAKNE